MGWLCLVLTLVVIALRWGGPEGSGYVVGFTATAPLMIVAASVALLAFLLTRFWLPALAAAGALVVLVSWQAPYVVGEKASGDPTMVVMSFNARFGRADMRQVAELVEKYDVDVAVLSELTPSAAAELAALVGDRLPHQSGQPEGGASGTVVLSRWATGQATRLPILLGGWQMRVQAPQPFEMFAVHTTQPLGAVGRWRGDLAALRKVEVSGPAVMAGDFNATHDHRSFRRLLAARWRDGAEQANVGWQPTWPHERTLPMPLLSIDHVLTRGGVAVAAMHSHRVTGSDHRALIAEVVSTG